MESQPRFAFPQSPTFPADANNPGNTESYDDPDQEPLRPRMLFRIAEEEAEIESGDNGESEE